MAWGATERTVELGALLRKDLVRRPLTAVANAACLAPLSGQTASWPALPSSYQGGGSEGHRPGTGMVVMASRSPLPGPKLVWFPGKVCISGAQILSCG